jgi:hypothetical protein
LEESKGAVEEIQPTTQRHWKRILLVTVFFSILAISLIGYAAPRVLYRPLRIDSIPPNAYIVPWMQPSPSIDEFNLVTSSLHDKPWNPDAVMTNALKLNVTFRIAVPNGTRIIESTVYLGHDAEYLYVAGEFRGMYRNPGAGKLDGIPQYLALFFDADNDGLLSFPESGSRFSAGFLEGGWHPTAAWGCDDMIWAPANAIQNETWLSADYYYNEIRDTILPKPATFNCTWGYVNSTGTWMILFSRYLLGSGDTHTNAFIMRSGERWVVGFNLELGFSPTGAATENLADNWPKATSPHAYNDATWWPELVIDLTNPPPSFST